MGSNPTHHNRRTFCVWHLEFELISSQVEFIYIAHLKTTKAKAIKSIKCTAKKVKLVERKRRLKYNTMQTINSDIIFYSGQKPKRLDMKYRRYLQSERYIFRKGNFSTD